MAVFQAIWLFGKGLTISCYWLEIGLLRLSVCLLPGLGLLGRMNIYVFYYSIVWRKGLGIGVGWGCFWFFWGVVFIFL